MLLNMMNKQRSICAFHCELDAAFAIIGGKWKAQIVWHIGDKTYRFNEMRDILETISPRMLSKQLHELEQDGLVIRTQFSEVPLRVEYRLTATGKSLVPILDSICSWVTEYCPETAGRIILDHADSD